MNFSFLPSPFKQLHRCVDLNFDLPAATNAPPPQSHTVSNDDDHLAERWVWLHNSKHSKRQQIELKMLLKIIALYEYNSS